MDLRQIEHAVLATGKVDGHELEVLRQQLYAGKIDDEQRKFLHELQGEAREVGPELEALFAEKMKQPPEQRTGG